MSYLTARCCTSCSANYSASSNFGSSDFCYIFMETMKWRCSDCSRSWHLEIWFAGLPILNFNVVIYYFKINNGFIADLNACFIQNLGSSFLDCNFVQVNFKGLISAAATIPPVGLT